ncbi:MAG TPA: glycosyltransferase family 2 protein, partial [Fluviicola sp.]|nr:glycosyltransferase family 2 protein [Fluviicola sp.]
MENQLELSIVVPLYNEVESLPELHKWIRDVLQRHKLSYEVIFVDDGSKDGSWEIIEKLKQEDNAVRGIKFQRNYGKSAALHVGFQAATGKVVVTMDADLQDSPDELPELHRMITEDDYDVVSGWKKKRYDPLSKTIPTKLYNWAARRMTGIYLHDFNCGLKAY